MSNSERWRDAEADSLLHEIMKFVLNGDEELLDERTDVEPVRILAREDDQALFDLARRSWEADDALRATHDPQERARQIVDYEKGRAEIDARWQWVLDHGLRLLEREATRRTMLARHRARRWTRGVSTPEAPYDGLSNHDLIGFYKYCAYRAAGNPVLSALREDSTAEEFVAALNELRDESDRKLDIRREPPNLTAQERIDRQHRAMGAAWAAGGGLDPSRIRAELVRRQEREGSPDDFGYSDD